MCWRNPGTTWLFTKSKGRVQRRSLCTNTNSTGMRRLMKSSRCTSSMLTRLWALIGVVVLLGFTLSAPAYAAKPTAPGSGNGKSGHTSTTSAGSGSTSSSKSTKSATPELHQEQLHQEHWLGPLAGQLRDERHLQPAAALQPCRPEQHRRQRHQRLQPVQVDPGRFALRQRQWWRQGDRQAVRRLRGQGRQQEPQGAVPERD